MLAFIIATILVILAGGEVGAAAILPQPQEQNAVWLAAAFSLVLVFFLVVAYLLVLLYGEDE